MVPGLAIEYLLDDLYVSYRLLQHFFFTFFHSTFPASAGLNVRCSMFIVGLLFDQPGLLNGHRPG
jgi:hypothetical protein